MNRLPIYYTAVAGTLLAIFIGETAWLSHHRTPSQASRDLVEGVGLPDLAVATEARYLRFRSLADIFSPFNEGPELLDHFPASFVFAPSSASSMPSKIVTP